MKYFLLIAFIYFSLDACGQTKDSTIKSDPENKYTLSEKVLPVPIGYINDFSLIYTEIQIKILDSIVRKFESGKGVQIAIVTLPGNYIPKNESFASYTLRLANEWGVGDHRTNRGILIAISIDLKEIRIQNGYGIEKIISDRDTEQIVDNFFIPYLKNGHYFEGTRSGLLAIIDKLIKNGA